MGYIGKVTDTAGNTHLVGSTLYGTCDTATATAAKVVTCPEYVEEVEGVTIHVHFTNGNTTSACTLNVNNKGAHTCVGASDVPGTWEDDSVASFTLIKKNNIFYWYQNDLYWENTNTDTKVTQTATTDNSDYPILFKNTANQSAETGQVRFGNTTNKVPKINPSTGNISTTTFNGVSLGRQPLTGQLTISSGTRSLTVNGTYTLDAACEKGVDTSTTGISSSSTNNNVPTSLAVYNAIQSAISGAAGALVYHGTASSTSDMADFSQGWYWIADASFTIGTGDTAKNIEPGDMLIANAAGTSATVSNIDVIQTNIETLTNPEITTIWNNAVPVS